MTATIENNQLRERLGKCPACESEVLADVYAIRYKGAWYHLRCASECDERERAASERVE
jgi:hypothetical protein